MKVRIALTALPLILVNIVAVSGQFAFLRDHLAWPVFGVAIFAAALESVALFLAYMSHAALMANDSAMRLRLAAGTFGLIAGLMNFSHYSQGGKITFVAVATGLLSASSPWLWGIFSRRQSRDALMAAGLIEPHSVRLGITRWAWHPVKSYRVFAHAAWSGEQEPASAIAAYDATRQAPSVPRRIAAPVAMPDVPKRPALPRGSTDANPGIDGNGSKADAVRNAMHALDDDNHGQAANPAVIVAWLAERGTDVTAQYVRDVRRRERQRDARARRSAMRAIDGKP